MTNQEKSGNGNFAGKYHLEISKSVQNLENSIPLIRGKRAYARVYFDHGNPKLPEGVYSARLKLDTPDRSFDCLNRVTLDRGNPVSRDRQRLNWDLSFNFNFEFDLDWKNVPDKIATGILELIPDSGGESIKLEADDSSEEFSVEDSPALKVTCLLLRYWNAETEDYVMPDPVQVDAIRNFVVSAFPVAEKSVEWKTIAVQASNEFRSLDKLTKPQPNLEEVTSMAMRELLLQTTVHRNMDTYTYPREAKWPNTHDIRTIYLAAFEDPSDRLGGAATDSPAYPVHNIAGASVVDLSGQIGAHELAHILGREHPGVPLHGKYGPYLGQRQEDDNVEKEYQRQEDANLGKEYMGSLNVESKSTQGLHINPQFKTPRIYEANLYFDLMTYRDPQWLSDYSYKGIKKRLDDLYRKDDLKYYETAPNTLVVIGEYDLNRQTGRILFVLPTSYKGFDLQYKEDRKRLASYQKLESQLKIKLICVERGNNISGQDIKHEQIVFHRLPDTDERSRNKRRDMPDFGIFQATVQINNLKRIELEVAANIVDVFVGNSDAQIIKYNDLLEDLVRSLSDSNSNGQSEPIRIEHPVRYMNENPKRSLLFYYDVLEDEYYLRFNWMPEPEENNSWKIIREKFLDSKIISTFQCKRPDKDDWYTVMISSRSRGKVWISSDLVEMKTEEYDSDLNFSEKSFYSHLSKKPRDLRSLREDQIQIRVLFSTGFGKAMLPEVKKSAKIYFPNEFLQNQQNREDNRNYFDKEDDPSLKELKNRSGKHRPLYQAEVGIADGEDFQRK